MNYAILFSTGSNPVLVTKRGNEMQIKFKTGKGELLFVKVPEDAYDFTNELAPNQIDYIQDSEWNGGTLKFGSSIILPKEYDFTIISLSSNVTEEISKDLVDELYYGTYLNYVNQENRHKDNNWEFYKDTAIDSFKSILQHLGINFDPIVLFKPNNN